MKLSLEQIDALVHGASYTEIRDGMLFLHRLTKEQEAFFDAIDTSRAARAECPAGVTLEFTTDSRTLTLSLISGDLTGRQQGVTVYANGERVGRLILEPIPEDVAVEREIALGEGQKQVVIRLPGINRTRITGLALEDGAQVRPVPERGTKLLLLGDSITQGYDAIDPEDAYAVRLGLALDAEVRNRAIGGDIFRPPYPLLRDDFEPDIVTVAYGTNDWSHWGDGLLRNCEAFYRNLQATYPNARLYALLPLWRKDNDRITEFGRIEEVGPAMRRVIEAIGGITVIDCFDFLDKDPDLLSDVVHPNGAGHARYAQALIPYIK